MLSHKERKPPIAAIWVPGVSITVQPTPVALLIASIWPPTPAPTEDPKMVTVSGVRPLQVHVKQIGEGIEAVLAHLRFGHGSEVEVLEDLPQRQVQLVA